jgi:hypothetical protein
MKRSSQIRATESTTCLSPVSHSPRGFGTETSENSLLYVLLPQCEQYHVVSLSLPPPETFRHSSLICISPGALEDWST